MSDGVYIFFFVWEEKGRLIFNEHFGTSYQKYISYQIRYSRYLN